MADEDDDKTLEMPATPDVYATDPDDDRTILFAEEPEARETQTQELLKLQHGILSSCNGVRVNLSPDKLALDCLIAMLISEQGQMPDEYLFEISPGAVTRCMLMIASRNGWADITLHAPALNAIITINKMLTGAFKTSSQTSDNETGETP